MIEAVVVPRELYYYEVAYVRGLEAALRRCREELEQWHDAKHVLAIIDAALKGEAMDP